MQTYLSSYQAYIFIYKGIPVFNFGINFCPSSRPLFLIKCSMILYGLYRASAKEHLDLNSFGGQVGFLSICSFPLGPLCCLPAWGALLLDLWQNHLSIAEFPMETWLPWGNRERAITKQGNHVAVCWSISEEWQVLLVWHLLSLDLPFWLHTPHILQKLSCSPRCWHSNSCTGNWCCWHLCVHCNNAPAPFQRDPGPLQRLSTHPPPKGKGLPTAGILSACLLLLLIRFAHRYWKFCFLFLSAGVSRHCQDQ